MVASFTTIYLPTLATFGTFSALLTVYFAQRDRREDVVDRWIDGSRDALARVAECVNDLGDASHREPGRIHLARAKLRAALANLPDAGATLPKCRALIQADTATAQALAMDALADVEEAMLKMAQSAARRRVKRSQTPIDKWRLRRIIKEAGLEDASR